MMTFSQTEFNVRCEWAEQGIAKLAPTSDAIIIADVMSFSTATVVATGRGAIVYPYKWKDDSAIEFAESVNAELAGTRGKTRYSLSPVSLKAIPPGTRLVLPSPNGSALSLATGNVPTFAGCLRNAKAVARAASQFGRHISVIPCGERWEKDGSLRPALEDVIGAGAIISHLSGFLSPEAQAALATFNQFKTDVVSALKQCSSGKELISKGFEKDIYHIGQIDVDDCAPILHDGAYIRSRPVV